MNLLILNGPVAPGLGYNRHYRGVHRRTPSYCDGLPEDHEINRLFYWYLDEGGEEGVVHDIAKACKFAQLWNDRLSKNEQFEVIEVVRGNAPPHAGRSFLGFDICLGFGGHSLLAGWLSEIPKSEGLSDAIWELANLIARFYSRQLNQHGLFPTSESAAQCLRSMAALQSVCPNVYEGGDLQGYQVVGVYLVDPCRPPGTP